MAAVRRPRSRSLRLRFVSSHRQYLATPASVENCRARQTVRGGIWPRRTVSRPDKLVRVFRVGCGPCTQAGRPFRRAGSIGSSFRDLAFATSPILAEPAFRASPRVCRRHAVLPKFMNAANSRRVIEDNRAVLLIILPRPPLCSGRGVARSLGGSGNYI